MSNRRRTVIRDDKCNYRRLKYFVNYRDEYSEIKEYPIYLFLQFFINNNSERNEEMRFCLRKNVNNQYIDKIYLLNERIYSSEELGIESDKIIQINIGKRLTFQQAFTFIRDIEEDIYAVTCNADMFMDDTINNIKKGTLSLKPSCQALSRYEYRGNDHIFKRKKRAGQDTWILFNKYLRNKNLDIANFCYGVGGCDSAICERLYRLGFIIYNEPYMIKTYHYHREEKRAWVNQKYVDKPYLFPKAIM